MSTASPYRDTEEHVPQMGKIVQVFVSDRGLVALDDQGLVWFAGSVEASRQTGPGNKDGLPSPVWGYKRPSHPFTQWKLAVPPNGQPLKWRFVPDGES